MQKMQIKKMKNLKKYRLCTGFESKSQHITCNESGLLVVDNYPNTFLSLIIIETNDICMRIAKNISFYFEEQCTKLCIGNVKHN